MAKGRLTLSIEEEIIKELKILAINENTTVTAIVEKLIVKHLDEIKGN